MVVFSICEGCALFCTEEPQMAIFPKASFFNHSCAPNALMKSDRSSLLVTAARDLSAGEEVFISYLPLSLLERPKSDRRYRLQGGRGFECTCSRCLSESDEKIDEKTDAKGDAEGAVVDFERATPTVPKLRDFLVMSASRGRSFSPDGSSVEAAAPMGRRLPGATGPCPGQPNSSCSSPNYSPRSTSPSNPNSPQSSRSAYRKFLEAAYVTDDAPTPRVGIPGSNWGNAGLSMSPVLLPFIATGTVCHIREQQPCPLYNSPKSRKQVGVLQPGRRVVAAGPAEVIDGFAVVPIQPMGAVDLASIQPEATNSNFDPTAIEIGDWVRIKRSKVLGRVRFLGQTKGEEGDWLGLECEDGGHGNCNGAKDGHQYFKCDSRNGLFVRPRQVEKLTTRSDEIQRREMHRDLVQASEDQNLPLMLRLLPITADVGVPPRERASAVRMLEAGFLRLSKSEAKCRKELRETRKQLDELMREESRRAARLEGERAGSLQMSQRLLESLAARLLAESEAVSELRAALKGGPSSSAHPGFDDREAKEEDNVPSHSLVDRVRELEAQTSSQQAYIEDLERAAAQTKASSRTGSSQNSSSGRRQPAQSKPQRGTDGDWDEERVAVKLQAMQRGRMVRKDMAQKRAAGDPGPGRPQSPQRTKEASPKHTSGKGDEWDEERVAIKLQAMQRGRMVRKDIAQHRAAGAPRPGAQGARQEHAMAREAVQKRAASPNDEWDEEKVAIKLQAVQRGRMVWKNMAEQRAELATSSSNSGRGQQLSASQANAATSKNKVQDWDEERVAVKLQAVQRGRMVRKHMAESRHDPTDTSPVAAHEDRAASPVHGPEWDEETVAIKIQAVQRGRMVRKNLARQRADAEYERGDRGQNFENGREDGDAKFRAEEERAAVKIQAIHRGRMARKSVAVQRAEIAAFTGEDLGTTAPKGKNQVKHRVFELRVDQSVTRLGLNFGDLSKGDYTIKGIEAGSWADKCGLKNGDLIKNINNVPTSSLGKGEFRSALGRRPVTVKVQRTIGEEAPEISQSEKLDKQMKGLWKGMADRSAEVPPTEEEQAAAVRIQSAWRRRSTVKADVLQPPEAMLPTAGGRLVAARSSVQSLGIRFDSKQFGDMENFPLVKTVLVGSWANWSCIHAGDTIAAINGESTDGLTSDELKDLFAQRPLRMEVITGEISLDFFRREEEKASVKIQAVFRGKKARHEVQDRKKQQEQIASSPAPHTAQRRSPRNSRSSQGSEKTPEQQPTTTHSSPTPTTPTTPTTPATAAQSPNENPTQSSNPSENPGSGSGPLRRTRSRRVPPQPPRALPTTRAPAVNSENFGAAGRDRDGRSSKESKEGKEKEGNAGRGSRSSGTAGQAVFKKKQAK